MLKLSKDANKNYIAKIVEIKNLRKHPNADKLQITNIDYQDIIVSNDVKIGDYFILFPLECQIHHDLLSYTNSYRDKTLNNDKDVIGFFEKTGRVRAVKLRGEKSMGYLMPIEKLEEFIGETIDYELQLNQEFDYNNDVQIVRKYETPLEIEANKNNKVKYSKISRIVDGQFRFHIDTEKLERNIYKIGINDTISISKKIHGTSAIFSHILVKKPKTLLQIILSKLINIKDDLEYDYVYASRKVIKNEFETKDKQGYYKDDVWGDVFKELKVEIPAGYTVYGEIIGYTKSGQYIQSEYDYGCEKGKNKFKVYRVTHTNVNGVVMELSAEAIVEFCLKYGLETVEYYYVGTPANYLRDNNIEITSYWKDDFINLLKKQYTEIYDDECVNKVPAEGVVVSKQNAFNFEAYKLKSFMFLEYETKLLDKGEIIDS